MYLKTGSPAIIIIVNSNKIYQHSAQTAGKQKKIIYSNVLKININFFFCFVSIYIVETFHIYAKKLYKW